MYFDKIKWMLQDGWNRILGLGRRLGALYHPQSLKQKGIVGSILLFIFTLLVLILITGWYWNKEPEKFDTYAIALERANDDKAKVVTGYTFVSSLIKIGETLLHKRGGYLSNDIMPPGVWMDNIPNWEFGALVALRDGSAALRNHISRSQTQSIEDPALGQAEPQFNVQNDSWIFPASETEYRKGLNALEDYAGRLADHSKQDAQFFARADNLRQYLEIIEKRLGSISQRLSASVGQVRVNTDLAGDSAATQTTKSPSTLIVKTPWLQIDDVFYEARGTTWALLHILSAVEHDFKDILDKKNALESTLSPIILNGSGFGLFSNYSLTMANYVARATAAVIDLRNLLEQG